jgi:hypothetical protein
MPTKDTARRTSGRRLPSRRRAGARPSKRLSALPGRGNRKPASRTARLAAREPSKRARVEGNQGLFATVGNAVGGLASSRSAHERSRGRRRKRLAGLLTAGGTVATAAFLKRRRGRRQPAREAPVAQPTPETKASGPAPEQEAEGSTAGGDTKSS